VIGARFGVTAQSCDSVFGSAPLVGQFMSACVQIFQ
jgi:hypothetical protein